MKQHTSDDHLTSDDRVKVLIVDDYELMHRLLRDLLGKWGAVQVVGEAHTGAEALTQVERLRPDVVIMDVSMPLMDGITAAHKIKHKPDAPRILLLTLHSTEVDRKRAEEAKVDAICGKEEMGKIPALLKAMFPDRLT